MSESAVMTTTATTHTAPQLIRILFVTRAHGAGAGGMERLSAELVAHFKKRSDVVVQVVAHRGSRLESVAFIVTCLPQVLKAARQSDIVHLGDPLLALVGWLVKLFCRRPVAVTVHGLDIVYRNFFYQLYLRLFFRRLDLYLPISRFVGERLAAYNVTGKIVTVLPAVEDRLFTQELDRSALGKLLGRDVSDAAVLLTVGRLVARKGHAWFIEHVLPTLPRRVIYVIAGVGPEEGRIRQVVQAGGLDERVFLLGRVSDEQLQILMNGCDAFVQPNVEVPGDVEGFGLVMLEAALCQRPVFAAHIEGITDATVDGANGKLLPSGDAAAWTGALANFIDNSGSFRTAGEQARQYTLENFSWETVVQRYLAAFRDVVK